MSRSFLWTLEQQETEQTGLLDKKARQRASPSNETPMFLEF